MFDFAEARTNMVDCQIHPNGVIDPRILYAFETLPRENFVPDAKKKVAYNDEDIVLENGRLLLEPQVHARMLQILNPDNDHVALVIGDSSGYVTATISSMVAMVFSLEEDEKAISNYESKLNKMGICNYMSIKGTLKNGAPDKGPYDLIFINGSVCEVPKVILGQLNEGGRLVCVEKGFNETMGSVTHYEATGKDEYSSYRHFSAGCKFLPGFEPKSSFSF